MRQVSIDLLRTAAIVVMVAVHFLENLSGYVPIVAGFGAPVFAFLSGMSHQLWTDGLDRKGVAQDDIARQSVRRGLFVFGVGIAFNVLVWLPEDVFNWDILTLIGTGLVVLEGARRLPLPVVVTAIATIVAVSPAARALVEWEAYWPEHYFDPDMSLSDTVVGYLVTGYFPLLPWLAYPLAGHALARVVYRRGASPDPARALRVGVPLIVLSLALLAVHHLGGERGARTVAGWTTFPSSTAYLLGTLGMVPTLFALAWWALDREGAPLGRSAFARGVTIFSRYSLSIYVLHHVVHLWPLWIHGHFHGDEPTAFWMVAMDPLTAGLLGLAFVVAAFVLVRWLHRTGRPSLETVMRWLC